MEHTTVTCDKCNKDLSDAGLVPSYYIKVYAERRHQARVGNFASAVFINSPLDREMHFCDKACLIKWLAKDAEVV